MTLAEIIMTDVIVMTIRLINHAMMWLIALMLLKHLHPPLIMSLFPGMSGIA